jgi:hypothetical protein
MYEMRPVETILRRGGEGQKRKIEGGEFNQDIL